MMRRLIVCISLLVLSMLAVVVSAGEISGTVVRVADGDTITVLMSGNRQVKVRLAEIDTPEKGQPWGRQAKKALASLVAGQQVRVTVETVDRYGRTVGRVYRVLDSLDVNAEMVAKGHALVYRKYAKDSRLYALEDEARKAGRGLWSLPEAERVPPWEWRRAKRSRKQQAPQSAVAGCGEKRYCSQMASCQEAMFYLLSCGLKRLDRDGDGVPCESLCR